MNTINMFYSFLYLFQKMIDRVHYSILKKCIHAHLCVKDALFETKKVHKSLLLTLAYTLSVSSRTRMRLMRLFETCHIHTYI